VSAELAPARATAPTPSASTSSLRPPPVSASARPAALPMPQSAAEESTFSVLALGDSGPYRPQPAGVQRSHVAGPVSTTSENSNRRSRQVSANHSEQSGIKT